MSEVLAYLSSPAHELHDPNHALQQLDVFYLDEPAPGLDLLGVRPGRPAVVYFCGAPCDPPQVTGAQDVRSSSPDLARQYALLTGALVGVLAVTALLISLSPPRSDRPPAPPTVARQAP